MSLLAGDQGFWGGTDQGLFRYTLSDNRLERINWDFPSSVQVTSIAKDPRSGILYLGTWNYGVLEVDPKAGRVINQYKHEPGNPRSLSTNNAYRVSLAAPRTLRTGTWGGGLNRLDIQNHRLPRYRP